MTSSEKWTIAGVVALAAWPAWLRGGTVDSLMLPLAWFSPVLLCILVWSWRGPLRHQGGAGNVARLVRDPVFYAGLCFLALLATQWWNAGRTLEPDHVAGVWTYSIPRVAWLPSAVTRIEAREMWLWFFPALTLIWLARHGLHSRRAVNVLLVLLALNVGLLAVFGVVQFGSGTDRMYGMTPTTSHFFAGFGYSNHAGEYFLLAACLAVGLFMPRVGNERSGRVSGAAWWAVLIALLSFVSVHLTLSRAAILLVWVVAGVGLGYLHRTVLRHLPPAKRLHAALGVLAVGCICFFAISGLARGIVVREMSSLTPTRIINSVSDGRVLPASVALRIWRDHPGFGVGGWGYRHFFGLYLPRAEWNRLTHFGEDATVTANVHNDAAQFLAEFGLVGFGLLMVIVLVIAWPILRYRALSTPLTFFLSLGLSLTLLQGLIDLPFRSPAVLYFWLALLVATAKLVKPESAAYAGSPRIPGTVVGPPVAATDGEN